MMKKYRFFLIALLVMILCACSKKSGEEYFPVPKKGIQWDYTVEVVTPAGVQKGEVSIKIEGDELISGKKYYKQVTVFSAKDGSTTQMSYNRRSEEGIYKIDGRYKDKPEYLITPFPIEVGSAWTVRSPEGTRQYKAERKETVMISNREYKDCLKVVVKGEKGTVQFNGVSYLAPGIGEVKSVLKIGEVSIINTLIKFKT